MSDWKWYGHSGHLIVGQDCRFHLCTEVGDVLISTVGEYLPDESVREILAQSKGVVLEGKGDARRADFLKKVGYEEIGFGRTYETMVFRIGEERCTDSECGCGMPKPKSWSEIDVRGYNTAGEATRGHHEMCQKWAGQT